MKSCYLILVFLLLLLPCAGLHAQWSGSVDATGGLGFMKGLRTLNDDKDYLDHYLGKTGVTLSYAVPRFTWSNSLSAGYESVERDFVNGDRVRHDQDTTIDALMTISDDISVNVGYRSDVAFRGQRGRVLSAWAQYKYGFTSGTTMNNRFDQALNMGIYGNENHNMNHDIGTGLLFSADLGSSRRNLSGSFSYRYLITEQENEFVTVDAADIENIWADVFRITPHTHSDEYGATIHYKDSVLTGKVKLVLDPGLRFTGSRSLNQNSGATASGAISGYDGYIWRDSTELREKFDFQSLDFQPYLAVDLSGRKVSIHADYALMFYSRKLTDDEHEDGFRPQSPYLVGNSRFSWRISDSHTLSYIHSMSVLHPTYLQVCWFDRSSGYIDRLYRGNPGLQSNSRRINALSYVFMPKRFSSTTSVTYLHSRNEIVQTWFPEVIDGRPYKIFTWVNGADTKAVGVSQKFGWRGKVISAGIGAEYNHTHRKLNDSDEAMEANDWSMTADIAGRFGKGWSVSTDLKYQSSVASFFAIFSDYCVLNAKISKTFGKLSLFLEGRDLADWSHESRVESADGSTLHLEMSYYNRRLVLLGCKWAF